MARSEEQYFNDVQRALRTFYEPGDSLELVCVFQDDRKCEMCGGLVDIRNCYELENQRTGKRIVCGSRCIVKYAIVLEKMNETPVIIFPDRFKTKADALNKLRRDTVRVLPPPDQAPDIPAESDDEELDLDECAPEGLGVDEIDWDSCDYE